MKHIYLFSLFLCLGTVHGVAQSFKIQGQVVNPELENLADVRISITTPDDSTVIATAFTDNQGKFVIAGDPQQGQAVFRLKHIAYKLRTYRFPVKLDTAMVIILTHNVQNIKGVEVTVPATVVRYNNEGNLVGNMEKIPNYEIDNAADALNKMPGVMVEPNLGILLFGDNVRIQVDGMDLKMSADAYLRSMPAAMFAEAELVANANGRYGEGGAVINFVTKRRKYSGYVSNIPGRDII